MVSFVSVGGRLKIDECLTRARKLQAFTASAKGDQGNQALGRQMLWPVRSSGDSAGKFHVVIKGGTS
jgi:hypothetical protein